MYQLKNLPNVNRLGELKSRVEDQSVVIHTDDVRVDSVYFGDHMFDAAYAESRTGPYKGDAARMDALRRRLAEDMASCLREGAQQGYRFAQAHIRNRLGVRVSR